MINNLKSYFPMLREREELITEIRANEKLRSVFEEWSRERREEFLDFCTGARGVKILYDSFFKEVLNPEYAPERLESFLCVILKKKVQILRILPNDSTRIADETSLLITDIVVETDDGSVANVEIQKIGYSFPGARSACYSADMLLRQYRRVRSRRGDDFSYQDIKNVYLIVIYEKSPKEFHEIPDIFYHYSRQIFESGLKLGLLQEYLMIPLDIFRRTMHNKTIETPLEAWLTFLSEDAPEKIIELITIYPEFKPLYETIYQICRNTERVMEMFSEELRIMDRNTVKYMIEEQQRELDEKDKRLAAQEQQLAMQAEQIETLTKKIEALSQKTGK
ncbi:MAG: hypothetical protein GX234_11580 [Clostridiales bacterium]|nr:hypothetical protein [Clostridiales bacterium]